MAYPKYKFTASTDHVCSRCRCLIYPGEKCFRVLTHENYYGAKYTQEAFYHQWCIKGRRDGFLECADVFEYMEGQKYYEEL